MANFLNDAKVRLHHNNKMSLAPRGIKNLADLLASEKAAMISSSKYSADFRKSSDALKEWGLAEGDDLADILPKLSILLNHLADAQSRFSDHDGTYRIHFKSVRMKEENLISMKKTRDSVQAKIITTEKKITKMSTENKDLIAFTQRLQELRAELASLEHSLSVEEARLSDFKRETVREGVGLRLGALLELAEKMTIISELGKMLIAEVPVERTAPGGVRPPYYSANRTQSILEEAQRCLTRVIFNPAPSGIIENIELSQDRSSVSPVSDRNPTYDPTTTTATPLPPSNSSELPPLYFSAGGDGIVNINFPSQSTPAASDTGYLPGPPRSMTKMADPSSFDRSNMPNPSSAVPRKFDPSIRDSPSAYDRPAVSSSSMGPRQIDQSVRTHEKERSNSTFQPESHGQPPPSAQAGPLRRRKPRTSTANLSLAQISLHDHAGIDDMLLANSDGDRRPTQPDLMSPPASAALSGHSEADDPFAARQPSPYERAQGLRDHQPRSLSSLNGETKTTNAGAFRRPPANSNGPPSQTTGVVLGRLVADESQRDDLEPHGSARPMSVVEPLNIHKRESSTAYHNRQSSTGHYKQDSSAGNHKRESSAGKTSNENTKRINFFSRKNLLRGTSSRKASSSDENEHNQRAGGFGNNRYVTNLEDNR